MKTHELLQGSPEWLAYRAQHFNASDAPAMMGCSPHESRNSLLKRTFLAMQKDFSGFMQDRVLNAGHRAEALARPLAEKIIGEELYPVTGSAGKLSASFDGLTLDERQGFEHKGLNADLRAAFAAMRDLGDTLEQAYCRVLPVYHRVQLEQQLLVSGAERTLFMASEWDADGNLVEEQHCWYYPDPALRQQILDGWAQFKRDLQVYVLPEAAEPAPVGKAPNTLPALLIQVTGAVTASNLDEFKATALAEIRSVNRKLSTDQDFADAEKAVKWCSDVETRVKAAKEHALSQTATIDALFKALDDISAEARTVRLDLDKLVARRKTEVKEEAVAKARAALDQHLASLNAEIAPMRVPQPVADFAGAIKGLKSFASMQDKLDQTLAVAKIAADADARAIRANVATFQAEAAGFEFLFADLGQVVHKAADDFKALIVSRVAQHKAAEEARARQREEAARAAAEAEQARQAEAAARAAQQAAQQQAAAPAPAPMAAAPLQVVSAAPAAPATTLASLRGIAQMPAGQTAESIVERSRAEWVAPAPRADEPATLKLGDICARMGAGFTMTAAFVSEVLQVKPAKSDGRAVLYRESDFSRICAALQQHIEHVHMLQREEAAA